MRPRLIAVDDFLDEVDAYPIELASMRPRLIAVDDFSASLLDSIRASLQ